MPKQRHLVTNHLENISWHVLDTYAKLLRPMIRDRAGVYALYKGEHLYYVGLASNLMRRVKAHLKDRHHGKWDRFSVYLTLRDDHVKELESLLLRIVNPRGNRQSGRFAQSKNLHAMLGKHIRQHEADRRAELLGGLTAKRRQKSKARKARGKGALKGMVSRSIPIRGWAGEWEYCATLRKNGTIRYGDQIYETPSAAARAAAGRNRRGWSFWHYRDKNREWVPLRTLKGG